MMTTPRFTLGTVPYLNAIPLYAALEARAELRIVSAIPALLAPMLQCGECDAALIPVVEHLRGVGGEIISDAGVGADGPVRSVLLFHRAPIQTLHTVAVDASSRSSVALLRVILHDGYKVSPHFREAAPDLETMMSAHSAALLIGDPALEAVQNLPNGVEVLDLAEAWKTLTGLPFVFAAWVTRRDLPIKARDELSQLFSQARDDGMQMLSRLARDERFSPTLSVDVKESYLRDAIKYHHDARFRRGLQEFSRRAEALKLL